MIEGAVKSLAIKRRGVLGEGAPEATATWELQAGPLVPNSAKIDFWADFLKCAQEGRGKHFFMLFSVLHWEARCCSNFRKSVPFY